MINKIRNILLLVFGIMTAIIFYGKNKKEQGKTEEQAKQVKVENNNLKKVAKIRKKVDKMSIDEIDKLC